jgi:hypothetical protein
METGDWRLDSIIQSPISKSLISNLQSLISNLQRMHNSQIFLMTVKTGLRHIGRRGGRAWCVKPMLFPRARQIISISQSPP